MPIDQKIIDEIETLTAEQLLTELREAKSGGKKLDPRTLKLAMEIIERAVGKSRAFQPSEEDDSTPRSTTSKPKAPPTPSPFKTKTSRDKMRRLPFLDKDTCDTLNNYAQQDGAEPVTPRGATDGKQ